MEQETALIMDIDMQFSLYEKICVIFYTEKRVQVASSLRWVWIDIRMPNPAIMVTMEVPP